MRRKVNAMQYTRKKFFDNEPQIYTHVAFLFFLSNFLCCDVALKHQHFPSVEHEKLAIFTDAVNRLIDRKEKLEVQDVRDGKKLFLLHLGYYLFPKTVKSMLIFPVSEYMKEPVVTHPPLMLV